MSFRPSALFAVLSAVFLSAPAQAEDLLDATDFNRLAGEIQKLGYRAQVGTDDVGDPYILSSAGGTEFHIFSFGCDADTHDGCTLLLFKAGFDLADGTDLDAVNDWNTRMLVGRAYLDDERDPWLEWAVNMDGGVSHKNFAESFDWWETALGQFVEHIDF